MSIMKKIFLLILPLCLFVFLISNSAISAAPPKSIHYQGRLKINDDLPNTGNHSFIFKIYNHAGAVCWNSGSVSLMVNQGVFEYDLANVASSCSNFNDGGNYELEVSADGSVLSPREKILATATSITSSFLTGYDGTNPNVLGDLALSSGGKVLFLGTGSGAPGNSSGRKINLFDAKNTAQYLIGVDSSTLYFTSPQIFSWYTTNGSNYTEVLKIDGGNLTVSGNANFYGGVWAKDGFTCGASDVAEIVSAKTYEAGSVVCISKNGQDEYELCSQAYAANVAGVVSENPGLLLNGETGDGLKLALSGRVYVKVTNENGPIQKGDALVSSSKAGYAMKGETAKVLRSMLIGKALEEFNGQEGEILILID